MAAFRVERTGPLTAATITVNTGGTSTAGTDYTALTNQVLNFAEGEAAKVVYVQVTNDTSAEREETITLTVSSPSAGVLGTASGTVTVWSDDVHLGTTGNDTITLSATTGFFIDAGDGNDTLNLSNVINNKNAFFKGGAGDDVFSLTGEEALKPGSLIDGGSGTDTLQLTLNGISFINVANETIQSIERIHLANSGAFQSSSMNFEDLLDINAIDVLRLDVNTSNIANNFFNFAGLGATQSTPTAGSTINDETGTARTVVASTAGAAVNDVVIGARTYDVYQFTLNSVSATLLIDTAVFRSITDVVL